MPDRRRYVYRYPWARGRIDFIIDTLFSLADVVARMSVVRCQVAFVTK